jgi:Glycosyl hydrolase family 14
MQLKRKGLRVQAVMSFHAAGNNVGDICHIPLPPFVLKVGRQNPDIFYRDREGRVNEECLSLACDEEPLFANGDTPLKKYENFMMAFARTFEDLLGESPTEAYNNFGKGYWLMQVSTGFLHVCVKIAVVSWRRGMGRNGLWCPSGWADGKMLLSSLSEANGRH